MEREIETEISRKEVLKEFFEMYIGEIAQVEGFQAAGIMNHTGEVIAHETFEDENKIVLIGPLYNDILKLSQESSRKSGFGDTQTVTINTTASKIVVARSETKAKMGFHLIGILNKNGDQAAMEEILTELAKLYF